MLYLASTSPRRHQLLAQLGFRFAALVIDVPEQRAPGEPCRDYVSRVAREKAGAGLLQVLGGDHAVVLAADVEVVLDDEVFGKPRDAADAAGMLRRLSGREHQVLTAVWCVDGGREASALVESTVCFDTLDTATIDAYVASGEPMGKAGGYAIQGRAAAFIHSLRGSYTGVMGLPMYETAHLLAGFSLSPSAS